MTQSEYLDRIRFAFSKVLDFGRLQPCCTFGQSHPINEKYSDVDKVENFPNPWTVPILPVGEYPNPGEYIQSELELLVLLFGLVLELKPRLVVETGCNVGVATRALGYGCWANGFGIVVSCDVDGRMCEAARRTCADLEPVVEIRQCPALELPELREADFTLIDSSYDSRSREHLLVKPGAVYMYHDSFAEPHVKPELSYEEFKVHLDSPRGFSIVRKGG